MVSPLLFVCQPPTLLVSYAEGGLQSGIGINFFLRRQWWIVGGEQLHGDRLGVVDSFFFSAFLLCVTDLVAYVSFCSHVEFVFDLVLRGNFRNICGFKQ